MYKEPFGPADEWGDPGLAGRSDPGQMAILRLFLPIPTGNVSKLVVCERPKRPERPGFHAQLCVNATPAVSLSAGWAADGRGAKRRDSAAFIR
jgi:hypothetical protein